MNNTNYVCRLCGRTKEKCNCVTPKCICGSTKFITEKAYYGLKDKGVDIDNIHITCLSSNIIANVNGLPIIKCTKLDKQISLTDDCKA